MFTQQEGRNLLKKALEEGKYIPMDTHLKYKKYKDLLENLTTVEGKPLYLVSLKRNQYGLFIMIYEYHYYYTMTEAVFMNCEVYDREGVSYLEGFARGAEMTAKAQQRAVTLAKRRQYRKIVR